MKALESKYSIDSFISSFIEGSSVISDLRKNLTILYKSWQDRWRMVYFQICSQSVS